MLLRPNKFCALSSLIQINCREQPVPGDEVRRPDPEGGASERQYHDGGESALCGRGRLLLRRHVRLYRGHAIRLHHLLPCAAAVLWPAVRRGDRRHHGDQHPQRAAGEAAGVRAAAGRRHGYCGARRRRAGGGGLERLGRALGTGGAAVPVRLGDRLHRRQLDRGRAGRLPRARRRRVGAGRRNPLRQRHHRLRAGPGPSPMARPGRWAG